MKSKIAIATASALMLISAPAAFADDSRPADTGGGSGGPVESPYPTLPSECQPTADRTAIECTYDYGDRIDVQPAFGCWTLDDGSEICVDPPEIVPVPGCNYDAGECEIVFDPATDRCVIERGTSATVWIGREGQFYVIDWPWGADEELDAALIRNGAEFRDAIVNSDIAFLVSACDSGQINGDGSGRPLPPNSCPDGAELCIPPMPGDDGSGRPLPPNSCPDGAELCIPPMPGEVIEDTPSERFDSPAILSGARAEKGNKQKKAKKKSRGKKSKPKKSSRR